MWTGTFQTASITAAIRGLRHRAVRWRGCGLDLLFPPRCAYCDAELPVPSDELMLCGECRNALGPGDWAYCLRCGAGVPAERPAAESCEICRTAPLEFDTVVSLGPYRSALGKATVRMKHASGDLLSAAMGRLYCLRRGADVESLRPDVVTPVPMFWTRRLARGTNSPDILAEWLARRLGAPLDLEMVVRRRNTLPQAGLKPRQRFANVRDAFRLGAGYDLHGLRVVLVDDILTTGATASEVAGLAKQAGASMVTVAVLARATGQTTPAK